ncbi:hypothetical protein PRIPAC_91606, partial [Pristionchus pacificus]
ESAMSDVVTMKWSVVMRIDPWQAGTIEQFAGWEYHGFRWKLRLFKSNAEPNPAHHSLSLICARPESNLWKCTVRLAFRHELTVINKNNQLENRLYETPIPGEYTFTSWDCQEILLRDDVWAVVGNVLDVILYSKYNEYGSRWKKRPVDAGGITDTHFVFTDRGALEEVAVNKWSLRDLGGKIRQLLDLIHTTNGGPPAVITDTRMQYYGCEEFANIINIINGKPSKGVIDRNVYLLADFATRFNVDIVKDKIISHLLSPSCNFSLEAKLVFFDRFGFRHKQRVVYQCMDLPLMEYLLSNRCRRLLQLPLKRNTKELVLARTIFVRIYYGTVDPSVG